MLHPLPMRFLRMYSYIYRVSTSRHWPSPLTHQDAARITVHARLVADKLANGKEPKEARRGCAIAIAIMGRRRQAAGLLLGAAVSASGVLPYFTSSVG